MGIISKLKSLDEKLLPPRFRRRIYGTLAGALVSLAGLAGAINYNSYRSEYVHSETEHISAPRYLNSISDSPANKDLAEFPIEIPGSARVDKYVTPNARYCLVHVRQQHLVKDDFKPANELTEKDKNRLKQTGAVQDDIYKVLGFLIKNEGLKEVYDEGLVPETKQLLAIDFDLNRSLDGINRAIEDAQESFGTKEKIARQKISELEQKIKNGSSSVSIALEAEIKYPSDSNPIDKYLAKLGRELEEQRRRLPEFIEEDRIIEQEKAKTAIEKKERYHHEAVKKAGFDYGLRIIPAETLEGNLAAIAALEAIKKGDKDPRLVETVDDTREDILLQTISKQQERGLAVSVYGGAHVWGGSNSFGNIYPIFGAKGRSSLRDNIAEWNQKHPDKKFSLIEVTPEHYEK